MPDKFLPIRLYDGTFFHLEDKYISYDREHPIQYQGHTVYPTSLNWETFSADMDPALFSTRFADKERVEQYDNLVTVRDKASETLFYQCDTNLLPYPQLTKDEFIQLFYDKCWENTEYMDHFQNMILPFREYALERTMLPSYHACIKVDMAIMCFGVARKDIKKICRATSVELDSRFIFGSRPSHRTKEQYPFHLLETELSGLYRDMKNYVQTHNMVYDLEPLYQEKDIKSFL